MDHAARETALNGPFFEGVLRQISSLMFANFKRSLKPAITVVQNAEMAHLLSLEATSFRNGVQDRRGLVVLERVCVDEVSLLGYYTYGTW